MTADRHGGVEERYVKGLGVCLFGSGRQTASAECGVEKEEASLSEKECVLLMPTIHTCQENTKQEMTPSGQRME